MNNKDLLENNKATVVERVAKQGAGDLGNERVLT
jgi:hypothetical protein